MNQSNYISLNLAKKLHEAGCEIRADKWWWNDSQPGYHNMGETRWRLVDKELDKDSIPAYSYYDILVTHSKEFFGEEEVSAPGRIYLAFETYGHNTLDMLQQGKIMEAEEYIWKNCVFNPDNK